MAGAQQRAQPLVFLRAYSLLFLALAVIGGIGSWAGALAGAALLQLSSIVMQQPFIQDNFIVAGIFHGKLDHVLPIFFGLGAIGLAQNPNGLVAQVREGAVRAWRFAVGTPEEADNPDAAAEVGIEAEPAMAARATRAEAGAGPIVFKGARHYHAPDCVFATGKAGRRAAVRSISNLIACPVCTPEPPRTRPSRRRRAASA
jgi:hypothetical protein